MRALLILALVGLAAAACPSGMRKVKSSEVSNALYIGDGVFAYAADGACSKYPEFIEDGGFNKWAISEWAHNSAANTALSRTNKGPAELTYSRGVHAVIRCRDRGKSGRGGKCLSARPVPPPPPLSSGQVIAVIDAALPAHYAACRAESRVHQRQGQVDLRRLRKVSRREQPRHLVYYHTFF